MVNARSKRRVVTIAGILASSLGVAPVISNDVL